MALRNWIRFAAPAVLSLALAGTVAHVSAAADAETTEAAGRAKFGEHSAHGGAPWMFVGHALDKLNLPADVRAKADAVRADLETRTSVSRSEREKLHQLFVTSVERGQVDKFAIDAQTAKLVQAIRNEQPAVEDAAQKIHDLLSADQRKALVEHARGRMHHGAGRDGGAAHEKNEGRAPHEGGMPNGHEHFGKIAESLHLTADQKVAFAGAMRDQFKAHHDEMRANHEAMKTRMKTIATAFESDQFNARALGIGQEAPEKVNEFVKHAVTMTDAAVRILTPAQRTELAAKLRAGELRGMAF